jgi:hypothetical protein
MKARRHRGGFAESMETMEEIEPTWDAMEKYFKYSRSMLEVKEYGFDSRKGWNAPTYIVIVNKIGGVLGMVSEDISE